MPHGHLGREFDAHLAEVAIVNFGSFESPAEVRRLHQSHPGTRLVVLANRPTPAECNQMLAFGATACLSKETEARDILNAIHLASRGLHVLPKTAREFGLAKPPGPDLLTPREADVLELLQQGRSNAEIARCASASRPSAPTRATSTASSACGRGASLAALVVLPGHAARRRRTVRG